MRTFTIANENNKIDEVMPGVCDYGDRENLHVREWYNKKYRDETETYRSSYDGPTHFFRVGGRILFRSLAMRNIERFSCPAQC